MSGEVPPSDSPGGDYDEGDYDESKVIKIQAMARGKKDRTMLKEQITAAVKIQSVQRGRKARREAKDARQARKDLMDAQAAAEKAAKEAGIRAAQSIWGDQRKVQDRLPGAGDRHK